MDFEKRKFDYQIEVGTKVLVAEDIPTNESKNNYLMVLEKYKGVVGVVTFCKKEVMGFGQGDKYMCGVDFNGDNVKLLAQYLIKHVSNPLAYLDFIDKLYSDIIPNKVETIRNGQALMNYLSTVNKELYDELTATENDCFHNDEKIDDTLVYLGDNWG